MAKFDVKFKDISTYILIVGIMAAIFVLGSYLFVDKLNITSALIYSLIAYPSLGLIKYVLLTIYWRKKKL